MKQAIIALVSLLLLTSNALSETINIVGGDNYAPLSYIESGKAKGILIDILMAVSQETGDEYKISLYPWARAYAMTKSGKAAIVGLSKTSARLDIFDYSVPLFNDHIQIVVLKGKEFAFNDIENLRGMKIGGVINASYGEQIDKAIALKIFELDQDKGQVDRLRKLLKGRIDAAFIGNGQFGLDYILKDDKELRAQKKEFVVLPKELNPDPLHLGIAKSMGNKEAIKRFDKAFEKIKRNGKLGIIFKRYSPN